LHPFLEIQLMENIFKGMGVALITPFLEDGTIDYTSLGNNIEHQLKDGIDFLCLLGSTAETPCLFPKEKQAIKAFVVGQVKGRVPLLMGIGSNCTAALVEEVKQTDFKGIDGILSVCLYYNKPSQNGIYLHYKALSEIAPVPVIAYNVPGRTGRNMEVKTILRIARELPNIVGIKEASGDLKQASELLAAKPENFGVLSGDDGLALDMIQLGACGVISVIGNAFPQIFTGVIHNVMKGNTEQAAIVHDQLRCFYDKLFVDGNPSGVKALLSEMGMCRNILRLPLTPVSAHTQAYINNAYRHLKNNLSQYGLVAQ